MKEKDGARERGKGRRRRKSCNPLAVSSLSLCRVVSSYRCHRALPFDRSALRRVGLGWVGLGSFCSSILGGMGLLMMRNMYEMRM